MRKVTCQYCGKQASLVSGQTIYPHRPDLYNKVFWQCEPCNAYVGVHVGSDKPLGVLANKELREAKRNAHGRFDLIWRGTNVTRSQTYKMLAVFLNIDIKDCHIGMFDVDMCKKVGDFTRSYWTNTKHHKINLLSCNNK